MTAPIFVDTNVLVYARDASEPVKQQRAAAWLTYLWREQLGRTSVQVLSEYYVTVTRKIDPGLPASEAWDDVMCLFAWHPWPVDPQLMARGREIETRYGISWWDSLVVAAAEAQACPLLLSEDLQDGGRYGSVTVRSPFAVAVEEAAAQYVALPAAIARHPSRGKRRPSK